MKIKILNEEKRCFNLENSGFSLYIDTGSTKILFDAGLNDEILKHNINFNEIDYIVLSHGHMDHTHGLKYLSFNKKKKLVCHPNALQEKKFDNKSIGANLKKSDLQKFETIFSKKIFQLSENSFFLGEIPRKFEPGDKIGDDLIYDDTGIVIKTEKGLVVVLGCGHSGLKNITEHIKSIFKEKLYAIVGGFHLLDKKTNKEKINYLIENYQLIYPMHCISEDAKKLFKKKNIPILNSYEEIYL